MNTIMITEWREVPVGYSGHIKLRFGRAVGDYYISDKIQKNTGDIPTFDYVFHRLNGPAKSYSELETEFWINGVELDTENYWKHPLVINEMLSNILEL